METNFHDKVRIAVKGILKELMERVMNKVLYDDPFLVEKHHATKPIYAALVPDEIFKGSHFERRFVTPFGGVWEKLAVTVAQEIHGNCERGITVNGLVKEERLQRIQQVLNELEHSTKRQNQKKPNWTAELSYILSGGGNSIPVAVTCDILIRSQINGKTFSFELKGPLPNSDQTKVSKEKIFKLLAMEPAQVDHAYYALPYNPYGKRQNYEWAFPMRWFDMKNDPVVLIGNDFWNLIGGSNNAYQMFIDEINALGKEYKDRIYREFLGIEPPEYTGAFLK